MTPASICSGWPAAVSSRLRVARLAGLLLTLSLALQAGAAPAKPKGPYSYYAIGTVDANAGPATPPATPSYVLMGGGPDVDEAFRWMIGRAGITPATGGRVVVIRAAGDGAYNPYLYYCNKRRETSCAQAADGWVGGASLGVSSVETLVIPSRDAADLEAVNAVVREADVLWIAGGDQSQYINFWKGTKLDATIQALMARNVPIGGTSAGLAVMGGFDYSALYASATSPAALADPYDPNITFDPVLPATAPKFIAPAPFVTTIMDSHLDSRDRMGRLVGFVSRLVARSSGGSGCIDGVMGSAQARGIGLGVETALLVRPNDGGPGYLGRRVTNVSTTTASAVYFVRLPTDPATCQPGRPLETRSVQVYRFTGPDGAWIDLDRPELSLQPSYHDAAGGVLTPAYTY